MSSSSRPVRSRLNSVTGPARSRIASALRERLGPGPAPATGPPPVAAPPSDLLESLRSYALPYYPEVLGPVTSALLERLDPADHEAILAAAPEEWRGYYANAFDGEQPHLVLHFAAHWDVQPALERLRLSAAQPPSDVHAMARGPLAAAGATWFADLVVTAAERAGVPLASGSRVLDFGCSSGRVLRVLSAWRDDIEWMGCDPNADAVAWADANIPGLSAFASEQEPPLPLADASLDLVFAISVWSHFGATQAERWLDEMHRVVRPGGALVFSTQGFASLSHYLRGDHISEVMAKDGAQALVTHGHKYQVAFGEDGDWGVKHPEWGMGYMTMDWLTARTGGRWTLASFEPGRIDSNQDLVVLVRR